MRNNHKLDLVNIDAYIKVGENLSICSRDIEWKWNFGVHQGPLLWYKFSFNNPQLDLENMNAFI